jgi:hypothetical protein
MRPTGCVLVTVIALLALLALAGTGSAAADGICKVNEAPCKAANAWPVGTVMKTGIKTGTLVTFKGSFEVKCTGSTWSGELTQNPTTGIAALLKGLSETFSGCTLSGGACSLKATEFWTGAKWFADSKSPGNGYTGGTTPVAKQIEMTCGIFCKWKPSESIEANTRTYQGGSPAIEKWSWRYTKVEGSAFCGAETTMTGEREFTAPAGSIYWTTS